MFSIRNLKLIFLLIKFFLLELKFVNFKNILFDSKQIIKPVIKIDVMKIKSFVKITIINKVSKQTEVIILFIKFEDIKYYQNFFLLI